MFYLKKLQLSPYKWKYSDLGILKNDNERTLTQSLPNEHLNNIILSFHFKLLSRKLYVPILTDFIMHT